MLRVGSYNIHRCIGTDGHCDPARIAAVLAEMSCDAIGLQEVDNSPGPAPGSLQLDFLARATGMQAVAGLRIVRHSGHYGNALLTRRPVLAVRRRPEFLWREPRGALDAGSRCAWCADAHPHRHPPRPDAWGTSSSDAQDPADRRGRSVRFAGSALGRHQRMAATRTAAALAARCFRAAAGAALIPRILATRSAGSNLDQAAHRPAVSASASVRDRTFCIRSPADHRRHCSAFNRGRRLLTGAPASDQVDQGEQNDGTEQRDQKAAKTEIALVDGAGPEQRCQ